MNYTALHACTVNHHLTQSPWRRWRQITWKAFTTSTIIAMQYQLVMWSLVSVVIQGLEWRRVYSVAFPINIPQRQTHRRTYSYLREATSVCELRTRMEYPYAPSPFYRPQWNCLYASEHQVASASWVWNLQFAWTWRASALLTAYTMDILLLECDAVYFGWEIHTFMRNVLSPYLGLKDCL
jgi:hypothetical protein